MKLTGPSVLLGLLVVLVLGGLWLRAHDAQVRQIAKLQASADSLDRQLQLLATREKARAAQDLVLADSLTVWKGRAAHRLTRVDALIVEGHIRDSVFNASLPDSLKAGFQVVVSVKDSVIQGLQAAVGDLRQSLAAGDARLALRDTSLSECSIALQSALTQRDSYRRMLHPNLLVRLFRVAPQFLAGMGMGLLLTR